MEILTSTGDEWSCGQAQNSVNFDFQVKFDLEGQGQSTPKTIGILTKMFCMSSSNLVILAVAGTSHKLSRRQARDWCPHEQTQATTIPEGQNWPRVKRNVANLQTNHLQMVYHLKWEEIYFMLLHDQPWIWQWIQLTSNESDITFHVTMSQLSDPIMNTGSGNGLVLSAK